MNTNKKKKFKSELIKTLRLVSLLSDKASRDATDEEIHARIERVVNRLKYEHGYQGDVYFQQYNMGEPIRTLAVCIDSVVLDDWEYPSKSPEEAHMDFMVDVYLEHYESNCIGPDSIEACLRGGMVFMEDPRDAKLPEDYAYFMSKQRCYVYMKVGVNKKDLLVADFYLPEKAEKLNDKGFLEFIGVESAGEVLPKFKGTNGYIKLVDTLVSYYGPYEMGFNPK